MLALGLLLVASTGASRSALARDPAPGAAASAPGDEEAATDPEPVHPRASRPGARPVGPPPQFGAVPTPPQPTESYDLIDQLVYYGGLFLLLIGAVALLYRRLVFMFSLEPTPELAVGLPASEAPEPEPAARRSAPAPPPPRAPAPAEPPRPRAAAQPSPGELLSRAAQALSSLEGKWVTASGLAATLEVDEATGSRLLDRLVDEGHAQEARTQDGQTVYRSAR